MGNCCVTARAVAYTWFGMVTQDLILLQGSIMGVMPTATIIKSKASHLVSVRAGYFQMIIKTLCRAIKIKQLIPSEFTSSIVLDMFKNGLGKSKRVQGKNKKKIDRWKDC